MKKINFIYLFFLINTTAFTQIVIDLGEKNSGNIENEIQYKAPFNQSGRFIISTTSNPNSDFYEQGVTLSYIGCPTIITYKNKTKLITANYSGDLFFYDLPTGRLENSITFKQLGTAMLRTTGSNKNSIITSMSLTDNEQYLVFKTYNFNGITDKYIDYYILDLSAISSIKISRQDFLYSLYAFPKTDLLNENKILI